ncbi:MAG: stage III sporulation protein AE [Lachnospiraceae bacterium]|nr:stage III sporulation protein AE [Lachnospiraceae bacterium]
MNVWKYLLPVLLGLLLGVCPVQAAEEQTEEVQPQTEQERQEAVEKTQDQLLEELELGQVEDTVNSLLKDTEFSFFGTIQSFLSGEKVLTRENLEGLLGDLVWGQLRSQKDIVLQVLLLILLSALLTTFAHVFDNGQISEMAFYIVYLVVFVLLLKGFRNLAVDMQTALEGSMGFMKVLTPAYYLSIMLANGGNTAGGYYALVLLAVFLVQWVMLYVVMPGVQIFVLAGIVNHLAKEDFLSKLVELLKTILVWIMRSLVGVIVGFQIIQRLVSPMLDTVQRSFVGKAASALPGIGNLVDSASEMMLGCALLIRNCVGATALVVLVLVSLGPVCQLGVATLLYRGVAALVQPVADTRMVGCVTIIGDGCALLLRILLTTQLLFFVTIAVVAGGSA